MLRRRGSVQVELQTISQEVLIGGNKMRIQLPVAAVRCACVLSMVIGAATCYGDPGSQTRGDRASHRPV
ncbi:MAG: hypothetical protein COA78_15145 [Blastopirellula sp.]|nr:MAG: hypothetical protein COA78_15145 [Blastopirellula sp.]